jgi:hypothetical protein
MKEKKSNFLVSKQLSGESTVKAEGKEGRKRKKSIPKLHL